MESTAHRPVITGDPSVTRKLSLLLLLLALSACAVSPTGRRQLAFMPASYMTVMGVQSFEQIRQETPALKDTAIQDYVQCVADAITALPEVQRSSSDWEVVVFDSPTVNAFALPGGKIGVYKGLLAVADTPDRLAAVLGHEVGHVLAHHGNERVSQNFAVNQTLALLDNWLAENNVANREQAMGLLGVGAQVGVLLPFSRKHESEADQIGQDLMAKAGFDPRASVILWRNMSKAGGKAPPEFLSTHPANETRIEQLQAGMDTAMQQYRAVGRKPVCKVPKENK
jgi:predicted Zn-dependent protease